MLEDPANSLHVNTQIMKIIKTKQSPFREQSIEPVKDNQGVGTVGADDMKSINMRAVEQANEQHVTEHQGSQKQEPSGGRAGITSHRSMQPPQSVRSQETGMG